MNIKKYYKIKNEQEINILNVRQSINNDVDLMYRLQHLDGEKIDPADLEQKERLDDYRDEFDASKIQVIEIDGLPIGRLRVVRGETIYIGGIQILPEYRNSGAGTKILLRLISEAKKNNIKITLEVFHDNKSALHLYKRLGFVVIDENKKQKIMEYSPRN